MVRRVLGVAAIVVAVILLVGAGAYKVMNSRTFQITGELTARVDTTEKVVALTFDDGPTAADTEAILGVLADHDVAATFFVLGESVAADPVSARAIVAGGHQLANHSWDHPRLIFMGRDDIAAQIEQSDAALRAVGQDDPIVFRPPHGKKLIGLPRYLAEHDRHTIMWDVAVEDYSGGPAQSAVELTELTLDSVQPGSIILLHPWNGRTATQQAIGLVITGLQQQGYRFVTVNDLLAQR